jgi:hypothetical protein
MRELMKAANEALSALNLDMPNQQELDDWHERNRLIIPCSEITDEDWEAFSGFFRKAIYIRSENVEDFAILKYAYYYPDGTSENNNQTVVIEDD